MSKLVSVDKSVAGIGSCLVREGLDLDGQIRGQQVEPGRAPVKRNILCRYHYYRLSKQKVNKFMMPGKEITSVCAVGVDYCEGNS